MAELVIVQQPPYGETAALPVFQWGHADTSGRGPIQVRCANNVVARVLHFLRAELPAGATVLIPRINELGVIVAATAAGNAYRVKTRRGVLQKVTSEEIWPLSIGAPAPGGADLVLTPARTLLRIGSDVAHGVRTENPARFRLRWMLETFLGACERDGLIGATWVDATLLPHQIAAVARVLTSPSIRHMLTDEVGLGKTVEAIMIWSALRADDSKLSTLVAVPRTLVPQWCFEFHRRAERRVRGDWYEGLPRIFVPASETSQEVLDAPEPGRPVITDHGALEKLTELPIDLLIIDESHQLNKKQQDAVDKLAERVKHLLLLTGTPRDAKRKVGIRARLAKSDELTPFLWALRLVDPKLGGGATTPEILERLEEALELGTLARDALAGSANARTELATRATSLLGAFDDVARLNRLSVGELAAEVARRATVFERVVRTRRRSISREILCDRRLALSRVEPRDEELALLVEASKVAEEEIDERVPDDDRTRRAIASSWKALARRPYVAAPMRTGIAALGGVDSKLEALCDLLGDIWHADPDRKVVLRATYLETRELIVQRVRDLLVDGALRPSSEEDFEVWSTDESIGPVAHVQDSNDSLIELLRRFSTSTERPSEMNLQSTMLAQLRSFETFKDGSACLLVASDRAGTGLNLQHASDLVLYDLPWKPQIAEQWIGRLDRLGRRGHNPVRIHVLSHPAAPDWDLIELYRALGLFDHGFHVPPEVATEIDRLIDQADAGLVGWREAIAGARRLLEQVDAGDTDDVLLELTEPDRDLGERLIEQAFDQRIGDVDPPAIKLLEALRTVGFTCEVSPNGDQMRRLSMSDDVLSLKDVRHVLRPPRNTRTGRGRDPMASSPTIDIDSQRLEFGTSIRRHASQFFSPQHPLFMELNQELQLDAGGSVGLFEVPCPKSVEHLGGSWIVCVLTRTFPKAASTNALWASAAPEKLTDPELLRVCDTVEAGITRMLSFIAPSRTRAFGRVLAVEERQFRLSKRAVEENEIAALVESLTAQKGAPTIPVPDGIGSVLAALAKDLPAVDMSLEFSSYQRELAAFIANKRRDVITRREKEQTKGRRARQRLTKMPENDDDLRRAELVFDRLAAMAADLTPLALEATRRRIVVACLIYARPAR